MKKLIIFGKSVLAELANHYFERDSDYCVCGFVADGEYLSQNEDAFLGKRLIAADRLEECYPAKEYDLFVAIGYSDMNRNRENKIIIARNLGYNLATYISSSAVIWDGTDIGDNCLIMENVVIQPFSVIGSGCVLSSSASISHGSRLEENVFMGSNAVLGGNVSVGRNSFIGMNASIRNDIRLADFSMIGAGTYISCDTVSYGVYGTRGAVDVLSGRNEDERKEIQRSFL